MIESEAVVIGVEGNYALLEITGAAGCGSCEKAAGCGLGDGSSRRRQRVRNAVGVRVGDTVILGAPEGAVLKAALRAYILPLGLALIGVASGLTLAGDRVAVLGGLAGLAAGWFALRGAGSGEPLVNMRIKPAVIQLHRKQPS
jgi:sigma-E factor negative regulatory protein RseC